jgi:hypothetical protein
MSLLVLLSGSTTSQPDYSLPNLVLMAVYVGLTLVLAIVAVLSSIISSKLSRDMLAASERQSQANVNAMYDQIKVSEGQAQNSIHNQYKPVIVPVELDENELERARNAHPEWAFALENAGLGIAMNVWGSVGFKRTGKYYSSIDTIFLTPNKRGVMYFDDKQLIGYPFSMFESYELFPRSKNHVNYDVRLMLTYKDVFDNRYLVIYDKSDELGWTFVTLSRVGKTMDEIAGDRSQS